MSKAFTREDDAQGAELAPPAKNLRPGEVRYLTKEGAEQLRAELSELTAQRSSLAAGQGEAAAASANAAVASTRGAELDRRIRQLESVLGSSTVAQVSDAEERVLFGAWVALEDDAGEETTFRIVGPDEADARAGKISAASPLARALLGRVRGDEVSVQRPRGEATYTIARVRYLP